VARDAENYPQLSRAYAIHRVGAGSGDDDGSCLSSRRILREFKNTITARQVSVDVCSDSPRLLLPHPPVQTLDPIFYYATMEIDDVCAG